MKRVISVCSARPNFVKVAAIHHAIRAAAETTSSPLQHVIVHTGQHYDPLFSDIFFEQLSLPLPQHNLGIHGGDREEVIAKTEAAFAEILPSLNASLVLVYGDVNGAVGPARVCNKAGVPLGHVEAGLRSFDMSMPEEWNRIAVDELADALFCSEQSGVDNLQREGAEGFIHLVGNTMIDTLVRMMPLIEREKMPVDIEGPYAIVTLHRPSNVDTKEALRRNIDFLVELSEKCPIILPVHHRLKASLEQFGLEAALSRRIHTLPPLGYVPFLHLVKSSSFILTDSGGIQEEATFLGKRCFTLRKNTERPSTLESGSNRLIDLEHANDQAEVMAFAQNPAEITVTVPPLWDGKTGERIVKVIAEGAF